MAGRYQAGASRRYRALTARDAARADRLGVSQADYPGQLRETAVRRIQRGALRDFGGRNRVAVTGSEDGMQISIDVLTIEERRALDSNRSLRAQWNRVIKSFADLVQERARRLSRPTYETGLFSSSWKAKTTGNGAKIRIALTNRAPYAKYVHRSGAPRDRTVVKTYIRPMVAAARSELLNELVTIRSRLLDAIRAAVLAGGG